LFSFGALSKFGKIKPRRQRGATVVIGGDGRHVGAGLEWGLETYYISRSGIDEKPLCKLKQK